MKRLTIAFVASAAFGFTAAANAADLPVKAPVYKAPAAVATNWTGIWASAGLGYGIWSGDTTTENPFTGACRLCSTQTQGGKGWLGVVGVGYDYQFAPQWLAGIFGDFNFGSIKGTLQDQDPYFAGETKEQTAWSVGGRLGFLVTPDALVYANGGYTSARFSGADMVTTFAGATTGFSTPATTFDGWFVGIGTETKMPSVLGIPLGPGWFWRNEYRYASYNSKTLPDTNAAGAPAYSIAFQPVVQTVTSQIVYKFNTGGPTYASAPAMPVNWNGIYVNGGLGYGGWAADTTTVDPATGGCRLCVTQTEGGKGWLGVVGVGFDYQVMPRILAGAFADFDVSSLKGTIQDQDPYFAGTIKQTSAWAAGVRGGWLVTPQVLTYGNVGFTRARFSGADMVTTFAGAPAGYSTPATSFNGWFLGGGLEVAITPHLFWRTEYRRASYESETLPDNGTAAAPGPAGYSITFKPTVQTITAQLVYKFDWSR